MSMEVFERQMKLTRIYEELETSEQQIKEGRTMDAKAHLISLKEKDGL